MPVPHCFSHLRVAILALSVSHGLLVAGSCPRATVEHSAVSSATSNEANDTDKVSTWRRRL